MSYLGKISLVSFKVLDQYWSQNAAKGIDESLAALDLKCVCIFMFL